MPSHALGVPDASDKETKTIYQVAARPGEDFFYVVYPHKDGEKLPTISSPAPGCIKVVTAESTDYCFLSDTELDVKVDNVAFKGKAGAVRVFPDRVERLVGNSERKTVSVDKSKRNLVGKENEIKEDT